jgi:hypothetical protein
MPALLDLCLLCSRKESLGAGTGRSTALGRPPNVDFYWRLYWATQSRVYLTGYTQTPRTKPQGLLCSKYNPSRWPISPIHPLTLAYQKRTQKACLRQN